MIDQSRNNLPVRSLRAALLVLMKILFRIEHHGMENIPSGGPLVVTANHVTYFDPFWIGVRVYRTMRFMTWDKVFENPISDAIFRWFGAFPVSLENAESGAYKASMKILHKGQALMVFPEGGRSRDGNLLPFKEGAARLALRTGATILPVAVIGGEKIWSARMRFPRPRKVRIEYLPPISCPRIRSESKEDFSRATAELTERIRNVIEERLRAATRA